MRRRIPLAAWALLACLIFTGCASTTSAGTSSSPTTPSATYPPVTQIHLQDFAHGLEGPVYLTYAPGQTDRLYAVEQGGRIRVLGMDGSVRQQPFLDISSMVSNGSEQGLFSVVFSPHYAQDGFFYIDYTDLNGDTVIARYRVSSSNPYQADAASALVILHIPQPAPNHNGGLLLFGRDGYLYIGMGDGGSGADSNGQRMDTLLGKILRIDVSHTSASQPYAIPPTNPFVGKSGVRPEIWATGLRNPWRFSFDSANGDLFIGDVGQNMYEEVDYQPGNGTGGQNYGWAIFEGNDCYDAANVCAADAPNFTRPVYTYTHDNGNCVVTGGYVYRGKRYPALDGEYIFGDYCSGTIWGFPAASAKSGSVHAAKLLDTDLQISSFGEDASGELYVVDLGGYISKITP